jgi:hypothetical protein
MLKALDAVFEDYAIVATNNSDILVVASPQGRLPALPTALPELPAVREALERAGVRSAADLGLRVVATRKLLHPLLARESIPVNSDYYPIVDQRAARSRFLRSHATALVRISRDPVPVLAMIGGSDALRGGHAETYPHFAISQIKTAAARFAASPSEWLAEPSGQTAEAGTELAAAARACVAARTPAAALAAIVRIAYGVLAWLTPEEVERVLAWIAAQPCGMQQHGEAASYLRLFRAIAARDANAMVETSQAILSSPLSASDDAAWLVAGSALTGYLALNRPADARKLVLAHRARFAEMAGRHLLVQIALAHAGLLIDSRPAAPSKAERAHREAFAANQGCQEPSPLVLANGSGHRRITMPAQAIGKGS